MLKYKNRGPIDYSLCNQVVTVFHADLKAGTITQTVINKAFFDFRKNENVNRTGQTETNGFLLVIPSALNGIVSQPVYNGDKVLLGTMTLPKITTPAEASAAWNDLIPSKVANLTVVKYVDPKYWGGVIAHWEAGG